MTRRKRALASIVLAAGAVASIATSQIYWDLEEVVPLPATILDVANPSVGYRVHAELTEPVMEPGGSVELALEFTFPPDRPNPAAVLVMLSNDADPADSETFDGTVSPESPYVSLYGSAFDGCEARPCVADFTVWIERTDLAGPPITPVMFTGDVRVSVREGGEENPPAGTELIVTVTELEESP